MRYSQSEKMEIIRLVEHSEIGLLRTLRELGLPKSTFYKWYARYKEEGYDGLVAKNGESDPLDPESSDPSFRTEEIRIFGGTGGSR